MKAQGVDKNSSFLCELQVKVLSIIKVISWCSKRDSFVLISTGSSSLPSARRDQGDHSSSLITAQRAIYSYRVSTLFNWLYAVVSRSQLGSTIHPILSSSVHLVIKSQLRLQRVVYWLAQGYRTVDQISSSS